MSQFDTHCVTLSSSSGAVDSGAVHAEPEPAGPRVVTHPQEQAPPRGAHPTHLGRRPQLKGEGE